MTLVGVDVAASVVVVEVLVVLSLAVVVVSLVECLLLSGVLHKFHKILCVVVPLCCSAGKHCVVAVVVCPCLCPC